MDDVHGAARQLADSYSGLRRDATSDEVCMFAPAKDIQDGSSLRAFLTRWGLKDYESLVERADADPGWFWSRVIGLADIRFSRPYQTLRDVSGGLAGIRWAVDATLNLTETCLDGRIEAGLGEKAAIDWIGEDGKRRVWTYRDLAHESARVASALAARGVGAGDAVGIYMPMVPEIEAALLGVARLGAIAVPLFSGYPAPAVAARLNDCAAKAVLTADASKSRGKPVPMESVLVEALADVSSVHTVISLRRFGGCAADPRRDLDWAVTVGAAKADFESVPVASDAPLMIAYTSGTTGRPKGVVHTHLGVQAAATTNFLLCLDLQREDRHLWMTDMGWVMGPLTLVSTLLAGATLVLAEGAPSTPDDPFRLLRLASEHGVTHLGVAPTLVRQFMRSDPGLLTRYNLSALRIVASTGEPWTDDAWLWHLEHICRRRAVPLNISGGTELFGAILTSTVLHTLQPCGFSTEALGVGAKVLRPDGSEARNGEVGELVVTKPPLGLTPTIWQDHSRYLETYWSDYPGIWRHGDWARRDSDGTWFILGRSDDTLNIAGKRIGPTEIEAALTATGKVIDAAAIAAPDDLKGFAVVCVCVPSAAVKRDDILVEQLKDNVAAAASQPFRPREIHFVEALPKTRSMKTMRRVVRAAFLGENPGDLSPLQNPEAIAPIAALRNKGR